MVNTFSYIYEDVNVSQAFELYVDAPYLDLEIIGDEDVVIVGPDGHKKNKVQWGATKGRISILPTMAFEGVDRIHVFAGGGADFSGSDFSVLQSDTVVSCVNDNEPEVTSMEIVVDTLIGDGPDDEILLPFQTNIEYDIEIKIGPTADAQYERYDEMAPEQTLTIENPNYDPNDPNSDEFIQSSLDEFSPFVIKYDQGSLRGSVKIAGSMPRWAYAGQPDALDSDGDGVFQSISRKNALIAVKKWADLEWTDFSDAFKGCSNLLTTGYNVTYDASQTPKWQVGNSVNESYKPYPTSLQRTFRNCDNYGATNTNTDINDWNIQNCTNLDATFGSSNANNLFDQDISGWDVSKVSTIRSLFNGAIAFNQDISNWDTSNMTNMAFVFRDTGAFNKDINSWNTSNVTNMRGMFQNAGAFNKPITGWNTSNVTNMKEMFQNAGAFNNTLDWDTSNVMTMRRMFRNNNSFNQDISSWDVSSVVDMARMFSGSVFNQNLNSWNFASLENAFEMLGGGAQYNQPVNWSTPELISIPALIEDNSVFNQPINFDAQKVGRLDRLINGGSFNQDISQLQLDSVEKFDFKFPDNTLSPFALDSNLSKSNADALLSSWLTYVQSNTIDPPRITFPADLDGQLNNIYLSNWKSAGIDVYAGTIKQNP